MDQFSGCGGGDDKDRSGNGESCTMRGCIMELRGDVGYLKKAINGNGEPGLLKDVREHRNQFAAHREEFREFVGTYNGVIKAERNARAQKENRDVTWRWIVGGLCTVLLALFLLLLGILLKEPLKDRGVISHGQDTYTVQQQGQSEIFSDTSVH
jgi:hypothetical protein